MPLPPYGETKNVPGTPAWRALHPAGEWFKDAKYNSAYDPMHFGDSNHGIPYQSPSTYTQQTPVPPAWQPPAPMPEQDQGQLFQNNNQGGESAVPSWKPPVQMANQGAGNIAPQMGNYGNPIQQRNQPSRYQSPSSRYLRNQGTF